MAEFLTAVLVTVAAALLERLVLHVVGSVRGAHRPVVA
jgi:hypothetical protein